MRAFEDFKIGDVMQFGPLAVTAADIKSFAARFDPQPMHLDEAASQNAIVDGMFASGLHVLCIHMRLFADGVLRSSTSMGSPGVDEVRYLAPVRAGDGLTLRVEVVGARSSKSRPEMGLVNFRSQIVNADSKPVLEMAATLMFGRRTAAGGNGVTISVSAHGRKLEATRSRRKKLRNLPANSIPSRFTSTRKRRRARISAGNVRRAGTRRQFASATSCWSATASKRSGAGAARRSRKRVRRRACAISNGRGPFIRATPSPSLRRSWRWAALQIAPTWVFA